MEKDSSRNAPNLPKRTYKWPWLVLLAMLAAIALAALWMSREIARTRRIRDLNAPSPHSQATATSGLAYCYVARGRL